MNQVELLNDLQDKIGYLIIKKVLKIPVKIIECKISFGKIRILLSPLAGNGLLWLDFKVKRKGEWTCLSEEKPIRFELDTNADQEIKRIEMFVKHAMEFEENDNFDRVDYGFR